MRGYKDKMDDNKTGKKKNQKTKPSENTDSPYVKLAIALEELCSDDFEFEKDDA
ncbi:hypothetical protein [Dysgonomonas termitidis]|uniref:Uncharacterized protein n=1 Tax=Dysgonomonas termitidis TaxID=1516126 RepID=A0ABV9L2H8_9BACT